MALLEAHRAGAGEKSKDEWLPLHCAARCGAPGEVVSALLEAHRAGAREATEPGEQLPLHLALEGATASDDVIEILLKGYPAAASIATTSQDDMFAKEFGDTLPLAKGSLPLHIASRRGKSVRVIKLLTEAYPQAVDFADANGETPEEVAGMAHNYREIIDALREAAKKRPRHIRTSELDDKCEGGVETARGAKRRKQPDPVRRASVFS